MLNSDSGLWVKVFSLHLTSLSLLILLLRLFLMSSNGSRGPLPHSLCSQQETRKKLLSLFTFTELINRILFVIQKKTGHNVHIHYLGKSKISHAVILRPYSVYIFQMLNQNNVFLITNMPVNAPAEGWSNSHTPVETARYLTRSSLFY